MISMDKQYRTVDGRAVKLLSVAEGYVFGIVNDSEACVWRMDGRAIVQFHGMGNVALLEVKPKITRTYWLVHEDDYVFAMVCGVERPDLSKLERKIIAITGPHTVEFQEGDGL